MTLTSSQRALLRQNLLLQLESASPVSLPLSTLAQGVRLAGFDRLLDHEVQVEVAYLADKGLATEISEELSVGLLRWRLSAAGREHLEAKGLI